MYLSGNIPRVRIEYDGESFELVFDTGNVKSSLDSGFAQRFPDAWQGLPGIRPATAVSEASRSSRR